MTTLDINLWRVTSQSSLTFPTRTSCSLESALFLALEKESNQERDGRSCSTLPLILKAMEYGQ